MDDQSDFDDELLKKLICKLTKLLAENRAGVGSAGDTCRTCGRHKKVARDGRALKVDHLALVSVKNRSDEE